MAAFKVNITKNGNAIKFQFTDSDHYLYGNGVVECPVNSLSLVIDESDFVTFKKASTNDTFITFDPANSNLSDKAGVIEFYKTNMVGSTGGGGSESGITSGEVQTMIDNSLEDYYTDDEVDAALSGKASASDVTAVANDVSTLSGQVATKVAITDFNTYSAATDSRLAEDEEVTAAALNDLQENKADTSAVTAVQQSLSGKQDTLVSGTNIKTINNESILGSGNITISGGGGQSLVYYTEDTSNESATIKVQNDDGAGNLTDNRVFVNGGDIIIESYNETDDGEGNTGTTDTQVDINSLGLSIITSSDDGIDTTQTELKVQPMGAYVNSEPIATEPYVDAAISGKVDTSAVTAVNDALTAHTANTTVHVTSVEKDAWNAKANIDHVTQSEYDAMVTAGTLDSNTMYIIDDAVPFDPSTKVDVSAITSSITSGSTDSEIPTAKAVYDATQGGGGGATYSAGTNISIDTANTINCTLNLANGTGNNSIKAKGKSTAGGALSFSFGDNTEAPKAYEIAFGIYNKTSYGDYLWGNSGNSFFTIGNGANGSNKHNAFEIRQNGDIYFPDTDNTTYAQYYQKPMVRLQDMYGALGGLKLVKCTQAEYDALATKDANTLYIISNVVS